MLTQPDSIWSVSGAFFALVALATVIVGRADPRLLDGAAIWSKPFKFALALAIYFLTFAVVTHFLPRGYLSGDWLGVVANLSVVGGIAELGYINVQAARGRHSHFNRETRIEAIAFGLMGLGAVLMLAPAIALGLTVALFPPAGWPVAVIVGTTSGLLEGAVLTVVTASRMGAAMSHFASVGPVSSRTMWLTGWSIDGSDLRPAHFMATHMMQAFPVAAICAQALYPALALSMTLVFVIVWTMVTWWIFQHALRGGSLSSLFTPELAANSDHG